MSVVYCYQEVLVGIPLKVSTGLFAVAKHEAKMTDRSITAQVEHWARIGRAVEAIVAHEELLTLKEAGEMLTPVFPSKVRRQQVHDLLMHIMGGADREAARAAIQKSGRPRYGTDPAHPGMLIQFLPDGTRRLGRLEGRRFVAANKQPDEEVRLLDTELAP